MLGDMKVRFLVLENKFLLPWDFEPSETIGDFFCKVFTIE